MNVSQDRGWNLHRTLIAVAAVAGTVFILTQLTGKEDGVVGQTVGTAYALAIFTVLGAAGAALARTRPRFALLGVTTVMLSLLSFGALVVTIWKAGIFSPGLGGAESSAKVMEITVLLAVMTATSSAMLLMTRPGESGTVLLVGLAGVGALALIVVLAILAIVDSIIEVSGRVFAIIATVYVLSGVLLFLLRLLPSDRPSQAVAGAATGADHADSDRTRADWLYRDVLGAEAVPPGEVRVMCLTLPGSAESALERLRAAGIEAVGPLPRTGSDGEGSSVYCRHPDGSLIELISYSA
jgi:hypothetical protein